MEDHTGECGGGSMCGWGAPQVGSITPKKKKIKEGPMVVCVGGGQTWDEALSSLTRRPDPDSGRNIRGWSNLLNVSQEGRDEEKNEDLGESQEYTP